MITFALKIKKPAVAGLNLMMNADKGYFFTLIEQPIALV